MARTTLSLALLLPLLAQTAAAQRDPRGTAPPSASSPNEIAQEHEAAHDDDESLQTADPDPTPPVPGVLERRDAALDVVELVGVGGPTAYGSAGVLEVGGSGALLKGRDFVTARFAPAIGWFFADGLQLSYVNEIFGGKTGQQTRFAMTALVDLSVHAPLTDRLLVMGGVGAGVLYNGSDWGFVTKPRVGLDVLIGRSGLIRPAFFVQWSHASLIDLEGEDVRDENWLYGVEVAYAAMF